jgi:hypothetical protein
MLRLNTVCLQDIVDLLRCRQFYGAWRVNHDGDARRTGGCGSGELKGDPVLSVIVEGLALVGWGVRRGNYEGYAEECCQWTSHQTYGTKER